MGSQIELNDTLKLKRGFGFPPHVKAGEIYPFQIDGRRLYNLDPARVFLVEEIDGKWNFVGHAVVVNQAIDPINDKTTGAFRVTQVYPPDYAKLVNAYEAPRGKAYVADDETAQLAKRVSAARR